MPICSICKIEKELDQFNFRNISTNKRHSACKICTRKQIKRHYRNNKEYYTNKRIKTQQINREWLRLLKEKLKCCICGESHIACLDFHHKNPNEKDFTISEAINSGFSQKKILEEIQKCDVLCANCHRKEHYIK